MSPVRMHFCTPTRRFPRGCFCPTRYGTRGCIPAVVNKTVGSLLGIKEALGITLCFFDLKNSKYDLISCSLVDILVMT